MARRVQGEAKKVKASKLIPSTVMDMTEEELRKCTRKYLHMKETGAPEEHRNMMRGMIRGVSTAYAMWFGSTPGQPKKQFIRDLEQRIAKEEREKMKQVWDEE